MIFKVCEPFSLAIIRGSCTVDHFKLIWGLRGALTQPLFRSEFPVQIRIWVPLPVLIRPKLAPKQKYHVHKCLNVSVGIISGIVYLESVSINLKPYVFLYHIHSDNVNLGTTYWSAWHADLNWPETTSPAFHTDERMALFWQACSLSGGYVNRHVKPRPHWSDTPTLKLSGFHGRPIKGNMHSCQVSLFLQRASFSRSTNPFLNFQ